MKGFIMTTNRIFKFILTAMACFLTGAIVIWISRIILHDAFPLAMVMGFAGGFSIGVGFVVIMIMFAKIAFDE